MGDASNDFQSSYTGGFGGVGVGADYTVVEAFRFGLALNMGAGYAQSEGDFNQTDNSFNFWGLSLYGSHTWEGLTLGADAGCTFNYSKVTQTLPTAMHMGALHGDVTSRVWTAGLRAEYTWETDLVDIIPHVGARTTSLVTDSYQVKNGGIVFDVEDDPQLVWSFPVGVRFTKDIMLENGWICTP